MKIQETNFQEAKAEFQKILLENNLTNEIVWVFFEDTFSLKANPYSKDFWLKMPEIIENERLTEKIYQIGQKRNLGICLLAFALCEDKMCCCLILPEDELDSEYLLMSSERLKFSFSVEMRTAKAVKSSFKWNLMKFLSFKYKQGFFIDNLPSKNLQFPAN